MGKAIKKIMASKAGRISSSLEWFNLILREAKFSGDFTQWLKSNPSFKLQDEDKFEIGNFILKSILQVDDINKSFVPVIGNSHLPDFLSTNPQIHPYALYIEGPACEDNREIFDKRAIGFIHSEAFGNRTHVLITNLRQISAFDENGIVPSCDINLADLYRAITEEAQDTKAKKTLTNWGNLIEKFGKEGELKRLEKQVPHFTETPSDTLKWAKRFGIDLQPQNPLGWDGDNYKKVFPRKQIPELLHEECCYNDKSKATENKLYWGDNLILLRSLPDNCIDLIYIDPPFFSGRNYNYLFKDEDEKRSFVDVWEGGIPAYLTWMNARLVEMKRVLKSTGSIYVHLDWHASHYVKVEMDKIFDYDNFQNEVVWGYRIQGVGKKRWARKHDVLLFYSKSKACNFYPQKERQYYEKNFFGVQKDEEGRLYSDTYIRDIWDDIKALISISKERIGYPTQKPEALLERIIKSSSNEGDVVADFFCGGGTTPSVAQKLGRHWVASDISRIAVNVTRDRLLAIPDKKSGIDLQVPVPKLTEQGFSIYYQGRYEKEALMELSDDKYISFILKCFEAGEERIDSYIHGFSRDQRAVFVSPKDTKTTSAQVRAFKAALEAHDKDVGVILSWGWVQDAEDYCEKLRQNGTQITIIKIKLLKIDSEEFTGGEENIRFLNRPVAMFREKDLGCGKFSFDATQSQGMNNSPIHFCQWDFHHRGRFKGMSEYKFKEDSDGDENPLNDTLKIEYEFPENGEYEIAVRVFDAFGASATHKKRIKVTDVQKVASNMKKKVA